MNKTRQLLYVLSAAVLACDIRGGTDKAMVDAALEELVPGARIGSTYGETTRRVASLRFEPGSSTSPGGEVPDKKMGFVRYSFRLGVPSYESAPDSAEKIRWIEIWSTSRDSADSVVTHFTRTLGNATDTVCLEYQGQPGYRVIRWLAPGGGVVLETPLREDVKFARLVFFGGAWSSKEHHRGERRTECHVSTR